MANRAAGQFIPQGGQPLWNNPLQQQHASSQSAPPVRQPFVAGERSLAVSERSTSTQEVEELLGSQGRLQRTTSYPGGWANTHLTQQHQRGEPAYSFFPLYVST